MEKKRKMKLIVVKSWMGCEAKGEMKMRLANLEGGRGKSCCLGKRKEEKNGEEMK